jgi:hypothetical protein
MLFDAVAQNRNLPFLHVGFFFFRRFSYGKVNNANV